MEVFDEDKAVEFIKKDIEAKGIAANKYSADDILEVIDIIWDYYEDNGFLSLDMGEEDSDADRDVLIAHIIKVLKKDKGTKISIDDVPAIVDAELAYEAECDEL